MRRNFLIVTIVIGLLGLVGCSNNSYESDYKDTKYELEALQKEYKLREGELEKSKSRIEELESKVIQSSLFLNLDSENKEIIIKQIEEMNIVKQKELEEKFKLEEAERKRKEEEESKKVEQKKAEEQAIKEAQGVNTEEVKQVVESTINKELEDLITNTTLDSVRVNENLGTDYNKDVVVLVDLSWSTKNSEKMTREMLQMFSDHLCAKLSSSLEDGSEIALFWDAKYTGLNIKHSAYIKNGNAYKQ